VGLCLKIRKFLHFAKMGGALWQCKRQTTLMEIFTKLDF
jgi:hypothetical protein